MISKLLFFLFFVIVSCSEPQKKLPGKYLDLKGFFQKEAARLKTSAARVDKTVSRNGVSESRKNISPDWDIELSLFMESDINKAAWRDGYLISNDNITTSYVARDSSLRTRLIIVKKNKNGGLIDLRVLNRTKNSLYNSVEELRYVPDSLYRIMKRQDVILLGNNSYEISGFFK